VLWLVIREEVPANQRDMVTLLLGTIAGTASSVVAYGVVHGGAAESHALRLRLVARVLSLALLSLPLGDFSKG